MYHEVDERTLVYRENRFMRGMRRLVDIVVALAVGLIAIPVFCVAAAAIVIEDGFPIVFTQRRVGRFERIFVIYKLRTMQKHLCGDRPSPSASGDPRVTRVGRLLRKTSIDELPQMLNVLRGEMSIVGPRPEMQMVLPRYERWQHLRHLVSPGITCIWQATCRSTISLDQPQATALDLDYIRRASPMLDGALLIKTVGSVVFPRGAY